MGPAPSAVDSRPENKRKAARAQVLVSGMIVNPDAAETFDCSIIDLSQTGARIRVTRGRTVPSQLILLDMKNRTAHEATVVWTNVPFVGIGFKSSYTLSASLPEHLAYLRKLWFAYATR